MRKYFLLLFATVFSCFAFGQAEMSVFGATGRGGVATTFVTDYQSLGINPANLGLVDKYDTKFSLGLAELGASVYSEALTRTEINNSILSRNPESLSTAEKQEAARELVDRLMRAWLEWKATREQ